MKQQVGPKAALVSGAFTAAGALWYLVDTGGPNAVIYTALIFVPVFFCGLIACGLTIYCCDREVMDAEGRRAIQPRAIWQPAVTWVLPVLVFAPELNGTARQLAVLTACAAGIGAACGTVNRYGRD